MICGKSTPNHAGIALYGDYFDLRNVYDAFGNVVVEQGVAPCSFGFSTKIEDPETGLMYYGLRYYDPLTGRWLSKDPIEEEGGLNLYGFVENDGVNGWDSLGMLSKNYGPNDSGYASLEAAIVAASVDAITRAWDPKNAPIVEWFGSICCEKNSQKIYTAVPQDGSTGG